MALNVRVTQFTQASPNYELLLVGNLTGERGSLLKQGTFAFSEVQIKSGGNVVLRAILPRELDIPGGLIHETEDRLRKKSEITEVQKLTAEAVEALRRLRRIEVKWSESGSAFLGAAASLKLEGEARLELETVGVSGAVLAEFRATATAKVNVSGNLIERQFGIVLRIAFEAAATLAIDIDDLNISLPDIALPSFDLSSALNLNLPSPFTSKTLAGAFSSLAKGLQGFTVTHQWTPSSPVLVVRLTTTGFRFAVMTTAGDDLSAPITDKTKLASLTATASRTGFDVTASGVKIAVHEGEAILDGTITVTGSIPIDDGERTFGPLRAAWKGVTITPVFTTEPSVSASVKFDRLLIHPIDDPAAVIAFRGKVEINPSGVRVVDLELVEPYPFVLVKNAAGALLRGAQKILQILGQLQPQTDADIEGLRKILEVLGRIAAAVGRAVLFVAQEVGEAIAKAVAAIAEALVELLEQIAKLIPKGTTPGGLQIDVEIRIALEPVELRQVLLTLRGSAATGGQARVSALGIDVAIAKDWRPAVLVDFVTEPGAYLIVFPPGTAQTPFATISTDLWLKRENTVAPVRDAGADGKRDEDEPLMVLEISRKAGDALALVVAGVSRGTPVFLKAAKNAVTDSKVDIPGVTGTKAAVVSGPFALRDLTKDDAVVSFQFRKERVLPLLGMGEAGDTNPSTGPSFLKKLQDSLGQVVWVKDTRFDPDIQASPRSVSAEMVLGIKAAGVETEVTPGLVLNLDTFEVSFKGDAPSVFKLKSKRIQERALGLTWVIEQTDVEKLKKDEEVEMFTLAFSGNESGFALTNEARMELRFDGLSTDGQGVVFKVTEFRIGRGGLDLVAVVDDRAVRLNGIDVPFRFTSGRLEIRGGKLVGAAITGRGQLPPALVGEANCTAALVFAFENDEIVLQSGKVELDKKGEPIVCHATRFTLTVTNLDIAFARDGGYHFYFLVSGSLRFTPKGGEFEDGLLKHLEDIEITLERAPLTSDPRVLLRHVSFQKALNPKKTFSLFNIFTFELRGFGFHPACPKFEGRPPALNISGQIRFAELGDVMQPKIDFHELWIAPPKAGESLPRIKAEGLGVELQLAGSVKIRGAVLAVDPETRTVEGREFAPPGYDTYGFLGEGAVDIPGFCALEASMGFLEIAKEDDPDDRKKAFFLFLQANKLAVEIPTPVWTFYLREAGFGFGYRYTLAGIADAENAKSTAQLVRILDDVSKRQGDLARFTAWKPDPKKDNVTLALRGAFQLFAADKTYDEKVEKKAISPLFFDIVAALRSDFTFLMSARGWVGVNYASFLENKGNFRERPTFRGYLYISVPRSELLLRGIADSKGYVGNDWPEVTEGSPLRRAIQSVDWSTTLYIRPGLFHYEMGWPDQLQVRLVDEKNMRVIVRGGMIFRAAEEGVLFGFNIGADAFIRFEGGIGGSIGVAVVAELNARFVARVLAFLAANLDDSLVYGLVSLDARLTFSVRAWMEVDLGFTSFTLEIGFSFSVQFTAAVELAISDGGVGGRVNARISVQVFGCSLGVGIGFSFNAGQLDAARARVERFLALSITAEEPDSPPVFAAKSGDKAIESKAQTSEAVQKAPEKPPAETLPSGLKPPIVRSPFGRVITGTDFWLVMHAAAVDPDGNAPASDEFVYALLVPKEPEPKEQEAEQRSGFYAAPSQYDVDGNFRSETKPVHEIAATSALNGVRIWKTTAGKFDNETFFPSPFQATARWLAPISVEGAPPDTFTLAYFFDECFLTDTEWKPITDKPPVRVAKNWSEPKRIRKHTLESPLSGTRDARNQQRDQAQKAQAAEATEFPHDHRAYQARSTIMTMFLDQFVTLCTTRKQSVGDAHVTDLGLVFYGPASELAKLTSVKKLDTSNTTGEITVFNPRTIWFDAQDPVLANDRSAVESDGIKLDWRLTMEDAVDNAEHFLHHYEVLRTIEGKELTPKILRVKPASTIGESDGKSVKLIPPDWQFVDPLEDLSAEVRRALLPAFGEAEGLEAAKAWLAEFSADEEVTVTYSVTPVDVAGARGLPRSFVVDILRPQPAIRPAVGELRVVQKIAKEAAESGAQQSHERPDDLRVFLALDDRAWPDDAKETVEIGNPPVEYTVTREYRVVADPDTIEPAGHYGSDATTSRVRGPGAFAPKVTADGEIFTVVRNATAAAIQNGAPLKEIADAETELTELAKLPRWALLDSKKLPGAKSSVFPSAKAAKEFRQFLWAAKSAEEAPVRVATRFFLETAVVFEGGGKRVPFVSKRVDLPVEHVISLDSPVPDRMNVVAIRPQAFEWAVPLVFPPLGDGQVRAESGFARFRVPKESARISDLDDGGGGLLARRDPERRVLTTVRFDSVPDWVVDDEANKPDAAHGTSIAGFDLYELDLDDLAPLDVSNPSLAKDPQAWQRARRVARIEHLSRENARLMPAGNTDWQGWQAHYPSETRRITRDETPDPKKRRESRPIRSAWYSDRESTPHLAARRPRLRFLPLVPETAIAELMRGGRPKRIKASLVAPSTAPGLPKFDLHAVKVETVDISAPFKLHEDGVTFIKGENQAPLSASDLRNLLLCIGWGEFAATEAWLENPSILDGLVLVLEGTTDVDQHTSAAGTKTKTVPTGRVEIPLALRSPVHPLLEEVLGELALAIRGSESPATYRRYNVMLQPVTPVTTKDLAGFMANTAPEADPYGWQILQLLGNAVTVRLFDAAQEAFLAPSELKNRVAAAFESALTRWRKVYSDDAVIGQPFAEVFLRPGADRLAGPFDAVIESSAESELPPPLRDDERLAFMQLSLRPRPVAVWKYMSQQFKWVKDPAPPSTAHRLVSAAIEVTADSDDTDVARALGGTIAQIEKTKVGMVSIPASGAGDELVLFFRVPFEVTVRPKLRLLLEWETLENDNLKREVIANEIDANSPLIADGDWKHVEEPASQSPDPFARFDAVSADRWTKAFEQNDSVAAKAFSSLKHALKANMAEPFTFPEPGKFGTVVSPYLTWSQRFLDHGASAKNDTPAKPYLALAAPTKASPWRLAADAEGAITLTFLHSDRWAHARAYAVRPIPRYHQLLAGLGAKAQTEAEHFAETLVADVGYAVAVSPRTERIETPVMVRANLIDDPHSTAIVVARHGEEALAASNRPLLARLGLPTSLLAFTRSYRMPGWPKRLTDAFATPEANELPLRDAELPKRPGDDVAQITGKVVRHLAHDLPSLWKGADIWRVDPIPPHYRLVALASERAGIVVSDIATIVQEEQPRAPLKDRENELLPENKDAVRFERVEGKVRLVLKHPLVSHKHLTPKLAHDAWLLSAKPDDVCFWPDPDVIYVLSRRLERDGKVEVEEEDADTRLVNLGEDEPHPVIVRARGPRYAAIDSAKPRITIADESSQPKFTAEIALAPLGESIDRALLKKEEYGEFPADVLEFNTHAKNFAAIITPHRLRIDLDPLSSESGEKFLERLTLLRNKLRDNVENTLGQVKAKWFDGRLTQQVRQLVTDLTAFLATADKNKTSNQLHDEAGLPFVSDTWWLPDEPFPPLLPDENPFKANGEKEVYLVVFDLASSAEIATLMAQVSAPVAQKRGRLYRLLARRILGTTSGFWLQAIDGRARIEFDKDGNPAGTPGVVTRKLLLADWLAEAAKQNQGDAQ